MVPAALLVAAVGCGLLVHVVGVNVGVDRSKQTLALVGHESQRDGLRLRSIVILKQLGGKD